MALFGVPVVSLGIWYPVYSQATDSESTGWGQYALRNLFYAAGFVSPPTSGKKVRVTLSTVGATGAMAVDLLYVGHAAAAGDDYDMDGSQVQITFSGGATASLSAGTTLVSDAVPFVFDPTKRLIVSIGFNATSPYAGRKTGLGANFIPASKALSASEAGTSDVTGYAAGTSGFIHGVSKIEIFK
jgi:hypothetical protein